MSESYITVTFTIPEERLGAVTDAFERAGPDIATEDDVHEIYGVLGPAALELIALTDENGDRPWVDPELTMPEQLIPESFFIDGCDASLEYVCGDEDTAEELARFMQQLFEVADFADVSVQVEHEYDDEDDEDDEDELRDDE